MAQGRRVERVASLIRKETSDLLSSSIRDSRVHQGMVSVTSVEVAGDLQHCKIFVSVYGGDEERRQAMEGLKAATPYVRGELGRRLQLRRTPEVVFHEDRSLARGSSVLGLLQQLEQNRLQRSGDTPSPLETPDPEAALPDADGTP